MTMKGKAGLMAAIALTSALAATSLPDVRGNFNPTDDDKLSDKDVDKLINPTREQRLKYEAEHPITKKAKKKKVTQPKIQYVRGGIIKNGVFIPKEKTKQK